MSTAISKLWSWFGRKAGFSEAHFVSNPSDPNRCRFDSFDARKDRYDVFWAHFEGNVFRKLHRFASALLKDFDLYPSTRTVYSPVYRGVEFWTNRLLGGILDQKAGDGVAKPSAIPINIAEASEGKASPFDAALRASISRVWRDSNWQVKKDNWTRFGAALGDVGLMIYDDEARGKVYLRVIHPGIVKEVDLDPQGNCKGYVLEEFRPDPRVDDPLQTPALVKYNEIASRQGERVVFETFLEDQPYDWRDYPDENAHRIGPTWSENYGFIPFVWHQHRDVELGAGWSEFQPSLSKLHELDDLASKVIDQVRKIVDCPWLITGIDKIDNLQVSYGASEDSDGSEPDRNQTPMFTCSDPQAKPHALVGDLDIAASAAEVQRILQEIERNHPELQEDAMTVSGSASGRARKIAREKIEASVVDRRAGYDDALVRAHKMAVSIGAQKGYEGFEDFDEGSFARGELEHTIGDRPVFAVDTMDFLEEKQARATVLASLTASGVPTIAAMKIAGYSPEEIEEAKREMAVDEQQKVALTAQRMNAADRAADKDPADAA